MVNVRERYEFFDIEQLSSEADLVLAVVHLKNSIAEIAPKIGRQKIDLFTFTDVDEQSLTYSLMHGETEAIFVKKGNSESFQVEDSSLKGILNYQGFENTRVNRINLLRSMALQMNAVNHSLSLNNK